MTALTRPGIGSLVAAAIALMSASSQAAVTAYSTQAEFLVAVSAPATDTFNEQPPGGPIFPYVGTAGSYGYSADAQFDGIYFVGDTSDVWLSTNSPAESINFYDFITPVYGISGLFFGTDFDGNVLDGLSVTLRASDGVSTLTRTLTNTNTSSFMGFVSDQPLVNLTVLVAQPGAVDAFTTVNDITLGLAAAVPEPKTYALWLGGLGVCGLFARRRRY